MDSDDWFGSGVVVLDHLSPQIFRVRTLFLRFEKEDEEPKLRNVVLTSCCDEEGDCLFT